MDDRDQMETHETIHPVILKKFTQCFQIILLHRTHVPCSPFNSVDEGKRGSVQSLGFLRSLFYLGIFAVFPKVYSEVLLI